MAHSPVTSAYIVHTQLLGLGNYPFPSTEGLRSKWHTLFNSETCFYSLRNIIRPQMFPYFPFYDHMMKVGDPKWISYQLTIKPFIKNLGPICFDSRSSRLNGSSLRNGRESLEYLLRSKSLKEIESWRKKFFTKYPNGVFGYNPKLKDQRMNYLYFQLDNPLVLKAEDDDLRAKGKVFIHIHPTGYIALYVAIALQWKRNKGLNDIALLVKETRPWRRGTSWVWQTRIGDGRLFEVIGKVKHNLQASFYSDPSIHLHEGEWKSAINLTTSEPPIEVASELLSVEYGKYQVVNLQHHAASLDSTILDFGDSTSLKYMIVSRQGLFCAVRGDAKRKLALRFFWKILTLHEFAIYKHRVYEDYSEFLKNEITLLKEYRLSLKRKLAKEEVSKLSVYDHKIRRFLLALDSHIKTAAPFHRFIYSAISSGTGLDARREKLYKTLEQWEEEVSMWQHGIPLIWKKALSPLRSLLSKVP